ncbi:alpha/beta hydrolase [Streptomyces stramineus]
MAQKTRGQGAGRVGPRRARAAVPGRGDGAATAADPAAAAGPARVVREVRAGDRMLDVAVSSPSLDAPSKWVRLLLPKGWTKNTSRTWPTLWMLHGGGGNHTDWTRNTHIEELAAARDAVVVLPETSGCSNYSDWHNHGRWGAPAWETYLMDELRPLLEREYRADPRRAAVGGLSMGGHGALTLTAKHPGAFRAAASYSGYVNPSTGHRTAARTAPTRSRSAGASSA